MPRQVVGTWRLKEWQTRTADGRVDYPLGPHPVGYLAYTPDGHLFVTIMRPHRPRFATDDLLGGAPEEKAQAASGFVAYSGRYEVRDGRVLHHIEISSFPNWVGTSQERFVELEGDRLTITTAPLQIGGTTTNRLVWERASGSTASPQDN